jgi:uncharacterized membrane protein YqaE (UPF0057 family)
MGTIIIVGLLYFLPTLCGWKKRNRGAIFLLNLLLGWTLIGWVVALVWAFSYDAPLPVAYQQPAPQQAWICSSCHAPVQAGLKFCGMCGTALTWNNIGQIAR